MHLARAPAAALLSEIRDAIEYNTELQTTYMFIDQGKSYVHVSLFTF